jgi:cysteine desulfurase / selenocysteine lyase
VKSSLNVKSDFPILAGKKLVYLDSAATSQKPKVVIEKVREVYENYNSNVHRGIYSISTKVTEEFDLARLKLADFIGAKPDEVIFTHGTTEGLNALAYTIKSILSKGRKTILLTEMEHHANLIPWQEMARREKLKLSFVKIKPDFTLDEVDLKKKLTTDVALFAFTGVSNTFGTRLDVEMLCKLARKVGALTVIDAAQLAAHEKVDVKKINCDFLVFSGHKILGPSGIGVLYGRFEFLEKLPPFTTGGSMIEHVEYEKCSFAAPPRKFEAGTPNIEGAIGLGAAVDYIKSIGFDKIEAHDNELTSYAFSELKKIKEIDVYHPGVSKGSAIISFNIKDVHPHDVASFLDDYNICVRVGHHCNMPIMTKLGLPGTVRVSFYIYNTQEDVDALITALKKIVGVFKKKV